MKITMLRRRFSDDYQIRAIDFFDNGQVMCFYDWSDHAWADAEPLHCLFGDTLLASRDHFPKSFSIPRSDEEEAFWAKFCETAGNSTMVPGAEMDGRYLLTIGSESDLAILRMML